MLAWLAYNSLCALPLFALAWLLRRLARVSARVEHMVWTLVLVRLILPPLPSAPVASPARAASIVASGAPSLGDEVVAALTRAWGNDWSTHAARLLTVLFLVTVSWALVRELTRARTVERCVRAAGRAPRALEGHVSRVAERLRVRPPGLRLSSEASGPFVWTLHGPVLVLPAGHEWPAETVLAHEFAHLERRDHWTAWLELVVQTLHFWNPLFWLARHRLHVTSELACDRWVVERFPSERRAFAAALIDTAERASLATFRPRAVQAIGQADTDGRDFEERLRHILAPPAAPPRRRDALGTLAALALALLTLPGLGAPSLARFRTALPDLPTGIDATEWERSRASAEERLRSNPEDGAGLQQLGVALLGLQRCDEALAAFRRQEALGYQPGKALYNQACVHARTGAAEDALDCLERAAVLGFAVHDYAALDPDLASLRDEPRFSALSAPE